MKWLISFPPQSLAKVTRLAAERLRSRLSEGATVVGVSILGNVHQAYREKARGGTGSDGIKWKELSPRTLEARVRRRAPSRRIVEQRRQLASQIKGLQSAPATKKTAKGRASEKRRREDKINSLRQKRQELLAKQSELIDREIGRHEIGVDTGLQRTSAAPGFTDPYGVWSGSPGDGQGQNLFVVSGGDVTVGFNREYSKYFDKERSLLPDNLPESWREDAERAAGNWVKGVLREEME